MALLQRAQRSTGTADDRSIEAASGTEGVGDDITVVPSGPLASVDDLHVTFRRNGQDVQALRGVSLEIGRGEILGIVGESGSGKSVLGLSMLGLLPTTPAPSLEGHALVEGVDMVRAPAGDRRRVRRRHLGAVFQDPMTSLNPTMRVGRQISEVAGSSDEALRLLDAVGVPEPKRRLRAYPHELSGGLRQRVMIALAIAGEPSLVIADEPSTALDVTVQAQILELLRHLCDEMSCSFVLVTHDLGVAAQISDRIAVLYGGRVAEVGTAADVLERPSHPYTIGLLRSRLTLEARRDGPLITLPGEPPDPRDPPAGCAFAPRCDFHTIDCDVVAPALEPAGRHPGSVACVHLETVATHADQPPSRVTDETEDPALALVWPPEVVLRRIDQDKPPAVVISDVTKTFVLKDGLRKRSGLQALRGVDLSIIEGESVALVGESGCGKSTLLRAIAGLHPIDGGSIQLGDGARPQMVFQDAGASLTPWLSVGELVGERLLEERLGSRARAERVEQALALVGLPAEVASAKAASLSGGQRQRVALARATVVPPEVLLCDEPTSALDVSLAGTVLNLLGRLRRELGMAILFVTHDLAAARVVADRIAVMYLGRIVEIGDAEQVAHDPQHPYTKALLAAVPAAGVTRIPLKGEPASAIDPPSGCAFHPRCEVAHDECSSRTPRLLALSPPAETPATAGTPAMADDHRVACVDVVTAPEAASAGAV
jgi:peptide/nickel transport system ATP-binding protein